jgi:pimeloyl-ACP methyl ester carboxylesterase
MRVRSYGTLGPQVVVLHGGPGAPGHMAPVARGLADSFRIIEPFQRGSGTEPLTVSRHVGDLHEVIQFRCGTGRPALVGSSWGAMLALCYAAEHPQFAGPLELSGCGTFDRVSRARMQETLHDRMDENLRWQLERLTSEFAETDGRLKARAELILPLYSYELITSDQEIESCDARGHQETWDDMVRLQEAGVFPATFSSIKVPILMLHGAFDPHPGQLVLESLRPYLPQIEYHEWDRCGHYPWLEKAVREDFFSLLRAWLHVASLKFRYTCDP